jgi:L-seryl-tRNA(Ser) seleniumtransferase
MDELLDSPWTAVFSDSLGRETVKAVITEALDGIRREIREGASFSGPPGECAVLRARRLLLQRTEGTLRPVVNATGVVLHTNLGRAPLAAEAARAAGAVSGAYSALEYTLETGERGERAAHVEWSVCQLTGAQAALVVNNNAAAVLLALSALAAGREVIVSCGELVEIGGSFRIPEILAFSGAKMTAVGCTNAARIGDYRGAVTENTAVLLKVHPSNYRIEGFVKSVSRAELAELAVQRGLVFMEDLGSGLARPFTTPFLRQEPTARDCLQAGCGLVTFSGDKLLGGPQIGVIAGSKSLVDRMKRHQLLRALRVDKMTLAAFDATLRLYLQERRMEIPAVRMIEADTASLLKKARGIRRMLRAVLANAAAAHQANTEGGGFTLSVVETRDAVGGGAYPTDTLPGFGVAVRSGAVSAEKLARSFRTARIPVIPGIQDGAVVFHARTLLPGDERHITAAFAETLNAAEADNREGPL